MNVPIIAALFIAAFCFMLGRASMALRQEKRHRDARGGYIPIGNTRHRESREELWW